MKNRPLIFYFNGNGPGSASVWMHIAYTRPKVLNIDKEAIPFNLIAQNPYLKVLIQSGYYDGATTYFGAEYSMHQVDPSGKMKDRFTFKGYRSGHMIYLRQDDLKKVNDDLREFILNSSSNGKAAKY